MTTPAPPVTLTTWLLAQLDAERPNCDGTGEYSECWRVSEQFEATIAAVRTVVELHGGHYDDQCQSPAHLAGPCRTLRVLAQPYAGNDGWDQGWAL